MSLRMTLHLTAADRELLDGIATRRAHAAEQLAQADRDLVVAGTGMATSRGLRGVDVVELTAEGLVVELPADVVSEVARGQ
ncbi:MAG: hypothetical protein JWM41_2908 [Gemmatimonadetes bacterium]|nr:hypothetical protein [Gemmatimonadota bacterium]